MIGLDWGTSSLRAWRLAPDGTILDRRAAAGGILTVPPGGFPAALDSAAGDWIAAGERHVLLAGMVGSRQGWQEAPYLPCPAGAAEIAAAVSTIAHPGAEIRLIPGLCDRDGAGVPEVMRGEETQIIGLSAALGPSALVCLPGSHAKWARIEAGRIAGFTTHLTGEAFAALRGHTILGRMMRDGAPDPAGFDRGVARSGEPGGLLHHLFGVRALGLFGELDEAAAGGFLSGLLIGHEVRAAMPPGAMVHLVGEAGLCTLYARAIAVLGGGSRVHDPEAAARGLALIGGRIAWT
jgi:2-dehydro-3-deoxygalactonokinase